MKSYIMRNRKVILFSFLFSLVCFGMMLTTHTIGIDEDTWILENEPSLLWLLQGRYGIHFMNLFLTDNGRFVPFFWDFLSVTLWNFAGVIFSYGLFGIREEKQKNVPLFFFLAYYSSLPFVAGEMLNFSIFNFQICIGMVSCAVAFVLSVKSESCKSWKRYFSVILLLMVAFSTYQGYICLFVTAVAAWCILGWLREETNVWKNCGICALLCLGGIILYFAFNLIIVNIVGGATYLSENYIGWSNESSVWKALFLALANIVRVTFGITIRGEIIYGGVVIRTISLGFLVWGIYYLIKKQPKKRRLVFAFFCGALMCSPFVLYVILGTYKTHGRVLLALPLAGAMELWLIFTFVQSHFWKRLCLIAGTYLLFLNARNMNWLFYETKIVYDYDAETADQIMYDVMREGMDYHIKPIVFIGCRTMDPLPIDKAGTIGGSLFSWDDGNNYRMRDFIETRGYMLLSPSQENFQEALKESEKMPFWPAKGSVKETEDIIIVHLSRPTAKWYSVNNVTP